MRLVVALGGNALLKRGEAMTSENQRKNVQVACDSAREPGKPALIESSVDIEPMLDGDAGTLISKEVEGTVYRDQFQRGDA